MRRRRSASTRSARAVVGGAFASLVASWRESIADSSHEVVLKLTLFTDTLLFRSEESEMPKSKCPAGFRQQIIELARSGRTAAQLARELGGMAAASLQLNRTGRVIAGNPWRASKG